MSYTPEQLRTMKDQLKERVKHDMTEFFIQHSEMMGMTIGTMKQIVHYQSLQLEHVMQDLLSWVEDNR